MAEKNSDKFDLKLAYIVRNCEFVYILFLLGLGIWKISTDNIITIKSYSPIFFAICVSIPTFQTCKFIKKNKENITLFDIKLMVINFGKFVFACLPCICLLCGESLLNCLCFSAFFPLMFVWEWCIKYQQRNMK